MNIDFNATRAQGSLMAKTSLSAIAGAYIGKEIFGPRGALPGACVPLLFYTFTRCEREWFNVDNPSNQLKSLIKSIITSQLLKLTVSFCDPKGVQVVQKKIAYYLGAVQAPFIEEIAFRGFLMDAIYYMQKNKAQKTLRVALQAFVFGSLHYKPQHGLSNYPILAQTTLSGCAFGYLIENTSNIALPLIYHSAGNFLAYYLLMK